MVVNISFTELSDYIKCHYKQTLSFSRISAKEVKISYEKNIMVTTISVPVNIIIENVESDAVTIAYSGNFGIEMIIAGEWLLSKPKSLNFLMPLFLKRGIKLEFCCQIWNKQRLLWMQYRWKILKSRKPAFNYRQL